MGMHVDKAGRDNLSGDIDFARALASIDGSDRCYSLTGYRDIGAPARSACRAALPMRPRRMRLPLR